MQDGLKVGPLLALAMCEEHHDSAKSPCRYRSSFGTDTLQRAPIWIAGRNWPVRQRR